VFECECEPLRHPRFFGTFYYVCGSRLSTFRRENTPLLRDCCASLRIIFSVRRAINLIMTARSELQRNWINLPNCSLSVTTMSAGHRQLAPSRFNPRFDHRVRFALSPSHRMYRNFEKFPSFHRSLSMCKIGFFRILSRKEPTPFSLRSRRRRFIGLVSLYL